MSSATCTACGRQVRWYAGRGRRLEDLKCPDCGSTLQGPTAGRPSGTAGKTLVTCALGCPRRGYLGKRMVLAQHDSRVLFWWSKRNAIVNAGQVVCRWHELRPIPIALAAEEDQLAAAR